MKDPFKLLHPTPLCDEYIAQKAKEGQLDSIPLSRAIGCIEGLLISDGFKDESILKTLKSIFEDS